MNSYTLILAGQKVRTVVMDNPPEFIDMVIPLIGEKETLARMWWRYHQTLKTYVFIGVTHYQTEINGEKKKIDLTLKFEEKEWEWEKVTHK